MKKDTLTGILLACVSIAFLYMTHELPEAKNVTIVGPTLFPYLAAGGLLLCSIALIFRRTPENADEKPFLDKAGWLRSVKLVVLLVLFPIMFNLFGFIISAIFLLFFMIRMFDLDRAVSLLKAAGVSCGVTIVLFLLFSYALKIQLPQGIIFG